MRTQDEVDLVDMRLDEKEKSKFAVLILQLRSRLVLTCKSCFIHELKNKSQILTFWWRWDFLHSEQQEGNRQQL